MPEPIYSGGLEAAIRDVFDQIFDQQHQFKLRQSRACPRFAKLRYSNGLEPDHGVFGNKSISCKIETWIGRCHVLTIADG